MEETNEDDVEIVINVKSVEVFDVDDPHFDIYIGGKKMRSIYLDDEQKQYLKQWSACDPVSPVRPDDEG